MREEEEMGEGEILWQENSKHCYIQQEMNINSVVETTQISMVFSEILLYSAQEVVNKWHW